MTRKRVRNSKERISKKFLSNISRITRNSIYLYVKFVLPNFFVINYIRLVHDAKNIPSHDSIANINFLSCARAFFLERNLNLKIGIKKRETKKKNINTDSPIYKKLFFRKTKFRMRTNLNRIFNLFHEQSHPCGLNHEFRDIRKDFSRWLLSH